MRNVTISLPDDVYRRARIRAAERETSLSGLVRELLAGLDQADDDFERRRRLQAETLRTIKSFRASDRLSRDDLHDRDALR